MARSDDRIYCYLPDRITGLRYAIGGGATYVEQADVKGRGHWQAQEPEQTFATLIEFLESAQIDEFEVDAVRYLLAAPERSSTLLHAERKDAEGRPFWAIVKVSDAASVLLEYCLRLLRDGDLPGCEQLDENRE